MPAPARDSPEARDTACRIAMVMIVISLLAATSGVASAVLPLAQLKLLLKHKHGRAFSLPYLAQAVASNGIWLAYGLMIHDLVLELSCAGGFVTGLLLYVAAIKYRNHRPQRSAAAIVAPLAHDPGRLADLAEAVAEAQAWNRRLPATDPSGSGRAPDGGLSRAAA